MLKTAILFDLDGTLLDTAPDLLEAFNILLQRYDKPVVELNDIRHLLTLGSKYFIQNYFSGNFESVEIEEIRQEYLAIYSDINYTHTKLFPGMLEILQEITRLKLPWGIVTNKLTKHTHESLNVIELPSQPQTLVCGDTLAVTKPDPAPLFHACELMAAPLEDVLFIGDSDVDAKAGKKAGIDTLIVEHGYNFGVGQFDGLGIAAWIKHPKEIMAYIRGC
jgi:phosphoglycolate phosphatase